MGHPEKHYFTIDDLVKRWGRDQAYVEYLLETRKPNGEPLLDAEYKESPYPLEQLEPRAQDRVRRLVVHPFPYSKVPSGEVIIMRSEVERYERENGIIKDTESESASTRKEKITPNENRDKIKDRKQCRETAREYVTDCNKKGETPSIATVIKKIRLRDFGITYTEKQVRNWITKEPLIFPKDSSKKGRRKNS